MISFRPAIGCINSKCLSQEQLSQLKKRLIFVEWNKDKKSNDEISIYSKNFEEDNKTLDMTRLFINDFSILYNALLENNTKSRYSITILRKLKEDIYDLVLTNDPKGQLKVLSPINKIEDKNKIDYVVGIGISKQFAIKGLIGVNSEDVYKDILFDTLCSNPEFNINIFIEKTLPELLKNNGNSIPIYKYIKIFNNDNKLPKRIKDQIKHNYTDLLNRYLKKNQLDTTIKILRKNYNDLYCSKLIARIKEENMNVNDLYEYLKSIFNNYPDILSPTNNNNNQKSDIRRLIKIYDWLKYYKK